MLVVARLPRIRRRIERRVRRLRPIINLGAQLLVDGRDEGLRRLDGRSLRLEGRVELGRLRLDRAHLQRARAHVLIE